MTSLGLSSCLLVPTQTGLSKAIMDATEGVRDYLLTFGLHDFHSQGQGQSHKQMVPAWFVTEHGLTASTASLYRPQTKSGDPRIWFAGLKTYARACDLLVILHHEQALYVINASNSSVWDSRSTPASPLGKLLGAATQQTLSIAHELLNKLRDISARGFIPSIREGDTGVGATLEHALGIATNASKSPDYKGIEIKASRTLPSGQRNKVTLFAQVPDWQASACKNAKELLATCGYPREAPQRLYCTVGEKPNSQGLYLRVDEGQGKFTAPLRSAAATHWMFVNGS